MNTADGGAFRQALVSHRFAISAELTLPDGADAGQALAQANVLRDSVDGYQIAESPWGRAQVSPLALAALMVDAGLDPIPRLTCRDRNRIALQSDLLGIRATGVSSVLLLRGSAEKADFPGQASPVFDLNCRELIAMANELSEEQQEAGRGELMIGTGALVPPDDQAQDLAITRERAQAGARFLQTQLCLDPHSLKNFMARLVNEKLTWSYSVIVSMAALPSLEAAQRLRENHPEVLIPDSVMSRMESANDPSAEGIQICSELLREYADIPGVSGANLLTLERPEAAAEAISLSGLRAS